MNDINGRVVEIDSGRRHVTLDTVCHVGETVAIDGQALVMTTTSAKRPPKAGVARAPEPSLA